MVGLVICCTIEFFLHDRYNDDKKFEEHACVVINLLHKFKFDDTNNIKYYDDLDKAIK